MKQASEQLTWMVHLLTKGCIPNALEELTIVVESKLRGTSTAYVAEISDICDIFGRSGLDAALVTGTQAYKNLRRVEILIDTAIFRLDNDEVLQSTLRQELPLLAGSGVLFGKLCDKDEVLARM
jgi:hypothetical protein